MDLDITPASALAAGTGTFDDPFVVTGTYSRISVSGPVHVKLQDVVIDGTGTGYGLLLDSRARVDVNNLAVTGSWAGGVGASDGSRLRLAGTVTIDGFTKFGLVGSRGCDISFSGACNLTITGNNAGQGIHLFGHSRMTVSPSGVNIAARNNLIGIQLGLSSMFQHHGGSGSVVVSNTTKPANSSAVQGTDLSSFSTDQAFTANQFTTGFELNSISYAEANGARTLTNLSSQSAVSQNSVLYLP